ncbi:MAG: LysM peptidoglycan-binding domain-containing protein [Verrucomicrobia bacterium]|nr:LysM peptidoglycan-binding domain-containing protein [Verrucomicrobiota bacterium]
MDTISRENTSYLPVAGVIVGVLALVLAGVALVKVSSTSKTVTAHTEQLTRMDTLESEARTAATSSERASSAVSALQRSTQDAFNAVSLELGNVKGEISKLQESAKAPRPAAAAKGGSGPATAGAGEYVIKSGDTGAKIARANNVSLPDLIAVNPGVNWSKLKVGDKVKLPKR